MPYKTMFLTQKFRFFSILEQMIQHWQGRTIGINLKFVKQLNFEIPRNIKNFLKETLSSLYMGIYLLEFNNNDKTETLQFQETTFFNLKNGNPCIFWEGSKRNVDTWLLGAWRWFEKKKKKLNKALIELTTKLAFRSTYR